MAGAGRKAAYSDKRLTDALYRYCETHQGKVQAADFCRWCGLPEVLEQYPDMLSLQGVEPRHFMRTVTRFDPETGKSIRTISETRKKLEEINRLRKEETGCGRNSAVCMNPSQFLSLSVPEQVSALNGIQNEMREMRRRIRRLEAEKASLSYSSEKLDGLEKIVEELSGEISRNREKFRRQITYIMNRLNREECRNAMEARGVSAAGMDFGAMLDYLDDAGRKLFSVSDAVKALRKNEAGTAVPDTQDRIEAELGGIREMLLDDD